MIQNAFNFFVFDLDAAVRTTLAEMLKPWSRAHVAEEVAKRTRHECSESTLNNYAAPSQNGTRCIPFHIVPALSEVTKSTALWDLGSKPIQGLLSKTKLEDLAKAHEERDRWERRIAELEGRV